ncbi:ribbon-helix-helix domain-containing protein [Nanoarchaeota archaeon]
MVMSTTQIRLPPGLIKEVNKLVHKGMYSNKSDVIRDAVRKLILENQVGSIPNTRDSVKEVREIRKKLSKGKIDLDEINKLGK